MRLRAVPACVAFLLAAGGCIWPFAREEGVPLPSNSAFYDNDGGGLRPSSGFRRKAAAAAYLEMLSRFGTPAPKGLAPETTDFRLGDFARFGAGVFVWANEIREEYGARDILLLPAQGTVELRHEHASARGTDSAGGREYVKDVPCKTASWLVRRGSVYAVFSAGDPNLEEYPNVKSRLDGLPWHASHVEKWEADGAVHKLPADETWYFFIAGPEGAVLSEFSNYHSESGVRWASPGAAF